MTQEERDLLIRMDEKLTNFINAYHGQRDEEDKRYESLNGRVKVTERVVYMGLGAVTLLQFIMRFWK